MLPSGLVLCKIIQARLINRHVANLEIQDHSLYSNDPNVFWESWGHSLTNQVLHSLVKWRVETPFPLSIFPFFFFGSTLLSLVCFWEWGEWVVLEMREKALIITYFSLDSHLFKSRLDPVLLHTFSSLFLCLPGNFLSFIICNWIINCYWGLI